MRKTLSMILLLVLFLANAVTPIMALPNNTFNKTESVYPQKSDEENTANWLKTVIAEKASDQSATTEEAKSIDNESYGRALAAICSPGTFTFRANSGGNDGPDGNVRTFTVGGVTVRARAFSVRTNGLPLLETAYLGLFTNGLGVTDRGEGNGGNNRRNVDNIGDRLNFVVFHFDAQVVPDKAFLNNVGADSDATILLDTIPFGSDENPEVISGILNNPNLLENNNGGNQPRTANFNNGNIAGNTLIISAKVLDSNDDFLISNLEIGCPIPTPFPEQDLTISQSSPNRVTFGQPLTYTLTVSWVSLFQPQNASPLVRFNFPTGVPLAFVSTSGTNGYVGTADATGVTFSGGTITSSGTGNIGRATLTVVIRPLAAGTLTSAGSNVVVDPTDVVFENNNNNTAQTITTSVVLFLPEMDLTISQIDSPDPVFLGQPLTYSLSVINSPTGVGGDARPVVRFNFPTGVGFTFISASGTNGFVGTADASGVTFTGGTIFSRLGGIPAIATLSVVIRPQAPGTLTSTGSGVVVDTTNVTFETDENNNTAQTITTTVVPPEPFPEQDLIINQSDNPDPVNVGQPLTYTLTVTNRPSALGGSARPLVRFNFPSGVPTTFISASGTNGFVGTSHASGVTFTGGFLSSIGGRTDTATLTVVLSPQAVGVLTSTGSGVVVDPNDAVNEDNENNNTAQTITTTVVTGPIATN